MINLPWVFLIVILNNNFCCPITMHPINTCGMTPGWEDHCLIPLPGDFFQWHSFDKTLGQLPVSVSGSRATLTKTWFFPNSNQVVLGSKTNYTLSTTLSRENGTQTNVKSSVVCRNVHCQHLFCVHTALIKALFYQQLVNGRCSFCTLDASLCLPQNGPTYIFHNDERGSLSRWWKVGSAGVLQM